MGAAASSTQQTSFLAWLLSNSAGQADQRTLTRHLTVSVAGCCELWLRCAGRQICSAETEWLQLVYPSCRLRGRLHR